MEIFTLTSLRKKLYEVVDHVLETGMAVEIKRKGRRLLITPVDQPQSKLAKLKKHHSIVGDPMDLPELKVSQWQGHKRPN